MNPLTRTLLAATLWLGALAAAAETGPLGILASADWSQEAALARSQQLPVMLVFSDDACGYCERLAREVLVPMRERGEFDHRALVREVDIHRGGKMTDFDGDPVRSRVFVDRYRVFATPTVVLVNHHGETLTESLVGYNDAARYRESLDRAISSALFALAAAHSPRYTRND